MAFASGWKPKTDKRFWNAAASRAGRSSLYRMRDVLNRWEISRDLPEFWTLSGGLLWMEILQQTFKKEERLSRKKRIDELFQDGSSFHLTPFRVLYLEKEFESIYPAQVLISVSSRNFPRAVDRNKVKRLIREGYRRHKHLLYDALTGKNKRLLIGIIYNSRKIESYAYIEGKLVASLQKIISLLWNSWVTSSARCSSALWKFINTVFLPGWCRPAATLPPVLNMRWKLSGSTVRWRAAGWPLNEFPAVIPGVVMGMIRYHDQSKIFNFGWWI